MPTKICGHCAEPFEAYDYRRKFCSCHCSALARKHPPRGKDHWAWRGGRRMQGGYVRIHNPSHPRSLHGYVAEHLLVMEEMIGRPVTREENVHHKNHVKDDNSPSNLLLLSPSEHMAYHSNKRWEGRKEELRVCRECVQLRPHKAKGLCSPCYWRLQSQRRQHASYS